LQLSLGRVNNMALPLLQFIAYDQLEEEFSYGATSSLEYKNSEAAIQNVLRQIIEANKAGKMGDLFAVSIFEYVKMLPLAAAPFEIYALTEAESLRLTNVVGVPMPVNFDKWIMWLGSAESAALSATQRTETATASQVFTQTVDQTSDTLKKAIDPKRSPIPFIVGGLFLLYIFK